MNRLPGIKTIRYVFADSLLANILQRALANVPVAVFADAVPVALVGDAICETDSQFQNNGCIEKVQLSFSSLDSLPTHAHICFIIETVNGKTFLVGTKEHPFPIVKFSSTSSSLDNEKAVNKFAVSYSNSMALIPCFA